MNYGQSIDVFNIFLLIANEFELDLYLTIRQQFRGTRLGLAKSRSIKNIIYDEPFTRTTSHLDRS